jgi:RimJ/RimL family protein N-acetyltransferase
VFDLGIESVDTGVLMGLVGLQSGLPYLVRGQVNLTYALYPSARGLGIATRAMGLAMGLAVEIFDPTELVIRADPENVKSVAVARRLGFTVSHHTNDAEGELDWYLYAPRDRDASAARRSTAST